MKDHLLLAFSTGACSCWDGFILPTRWGFGFAFGCIDPKGLLGLLKIRNEKMRKEKCLKVTSADSNLLRKNGSVQEAKDWMAHLGCFN